MKYLDWIESNKDEMVKTLQELLRIKSVVGEKEGDAPFGKGVAEAYKYFMDKAEDYGFVCKDVDGYGGHVEFGGYELDENGEKIKTSDEIMGILGHLDVVPEGTDWDYDPYGAEIVDGRIYARGAMDDKGPVMAAFFAMKALKECGYIPKKQVRLILGLDEETNWYGMDYYFSKEKLPDFGFTPDAEFPAIHAEMGISIFSLAKKISKSSGKGISLRKLEGGNAPNMVADWSRAVINSDNKNHYDEIRQMVDEYIKKNCVAGGKTEKATIKVKGVGKSLEISVVGVSAHGARPKFGLNAISVLMDILQKIEFENDQVAEFIKFYNEKINFELDGESMGCGLSDEVSGKLIFNVGKIEFDGEVIILTINVRYPVTKTEDEMYDGMKENIEKYGLGLIKGKSQLPIYMPVDHPMIVTLMDVYREHTGDKESKPIVIGGGTYARAGKNIVAYGSVFPGEPELAHQKNEYIKVDDLVMCAKIYADAIYKLTK